MGIFDQLIQSSGVKTSSINKTLLAILKWLVGIAGALVILSILFPKAVTIIIDIVWVVSLSVVAIFLVLGVLVILGLRKEAAHILDVLVERSLTIIDLIEFIKLVYKRFIELLKEFLLYVAPVLAYILAALIYVALIVLYKSVGSKIDVTIFTIVLTVILVASIGILNSPKRKIVVVETWWSNFKVFFRKSLIDGFEVVLFIFFLTIDSTNLFFLPKHLNTTINANFMGYNLMEKGFTFTDHLNWTVNIIAFAVICEIIRYSMRIIAAAKIHYSQLAEGTKTIKIKTSIRLAFADAKPEVVRFITFTTIIFSVFLLFPRLKLMSLAVTSFTNLILDIFVKERLVIVRGKDLLNRVIDWVFRL